MSTQLIAFTSDQIDVIYKATHLTETLNKKLATALPPGIYRGFNLSSDTITTDQIQIDPDPSGDGHIAVVENEADRSITIRRDGSTFVLDVSALRAAGTKKYVIAVWGKYAKGSNTGAAIRAYETYPINELLTAPEASTLAILGEISLTGAAPAAIPLADISQARRTSAWQNAAPEGGFWKPLLQNGNFEASDVAVNETWPAYGWRLGDGNSLLGPSATDARTGTRCLNWLAAATNSLTFTAQQYVGEPLSGTERIRVRGFYKILQVPTAGEIEVVLQFGDLNGEAVTEVTYSIPTDTVSTDWEEFGAIVDVPVLATKLVSFSLECDDTVMDVPSVANVARFDDWQVWKSFDGIENQQASRLGDRVDASLRDLMFPLDAFSDRETAPRLNRSVATLQGEKTIDVAEGALRARKYFGVGDDLVSNITDAAKPRISAPFRAANQIADGDTHTLLLESLPHTGTESSVRIYVNDLGQLFLSHNASIGASGVWLKDDITEVASLVKIGDRDGLEAFISPADGGVSASFYSYFDFMASHLLSDSSYSDFTSLWEVEDGVLTGVAPYTGDSTALGATGWWEFTGGGSEQSFDQLLVDTTFAFIEDGTYKGWWRVIGLDADPGPAAVRLGRLSDGAAWTFSVSETATIRFYQGIQIGRPAGGRLGFHMVQNPVAPTDPHIEIEKPNSINPFSVTGDGHVTATRYSYPDSPYLHLNVPLTLFQPTVHTDWDLIGFGSGTEMYFESDSLADYLVAELPLELGDVLRRIHFNIQAASASSQLTSVYDYLGATLASGNSGGSTSRQTETYTVNHPVTVAGRLPRAVVASGTAGDRLYYVTLEVQRLGV